jgi:ABC-2 type transport system permease protein
MLLSGLFTPISSMPSWAQWLTYAFPPRYVINIFRSVYLKGTLLTELWFDYIMLSVLAAGFYILATVTYKKQN